MLASKIQVDAFDMYQREVAPASGTLLSGNYRVDLDYRSAPAPDYSFSQDSNVLNYGNDNVSGVLGLELTDKTTRGVFEERPIIKTGSFFDKYKEGYPVSYPDNASVLKNSALEGFETYKWGNPLEANYGDTIAQASGQDDSQFVAEAEEESTAIPGIPSALDVFTKPSLRREVYIFIIGSIILAIGIFALTR